MSKKCHHWTVEQEEQLLRAVEDCKVLFEHYDTQSSAYTQLNAWDAVAGRMLPEVVVTGAACKRRFEKVSAQEDSWATVAAMVERYEAGLVESTFDAVSKLAVSCEELRKLILEVKGDVKALKKVWE